MGLRSEYFSDELKRIYGEDAIELLSELEIVYGASHYLAFLSGLYSSPAPVNRVAERFLERMRRSREMCEELEDWLDHVAASAQPPHDPSEASGEESYQCLTQPRSSALRSKSPEMRAYLTL